MSTDTKKRAFDEFSDDDEDVSQTNKKRKLNDDDEDYMPKPSTKPKAKAKPKSAKKKNPKEKKPRGAIPGHCSFGTKKEIGDALKSLVSLEKWSIPAKCLEVEMDCEAFKHLFAEQGDITPTEFDQSTDIVVCRLDGSKAGEIFGKTKVKGGSMYGTYTIEKMDIVFFPAQRSARIWFAVDGW